ncbi:MAG: hypothetical protein HKO59_14490 [Phycisphaerales bacterium]|nr:hypothetical protein [Phycisphaerales bacterium]NNM27169.1 hypothetical protein [Phycisphaerales bacterium]
MNAHKLVLLTASTITFALVGCDVDVERKAELPTIKVEGGQLPELDVDMADVDLETKTVEVEVPSGIDIDFPEDPGEVGDGAPPAEDD